MKKYYVTNEKKVEKFEKKELLEIKYDKINLLNKKKSDPSNIKNQCWAKCSKRDWLEVLSEIIFTFARLIRKMRIK